MSRLSEHLAELREHWDRNDKWFDVMCVTLVRGHIDEISKQATAITDLEALVGELGEALADIVGSTLGGKVGASDSDTYAIYPPSPNALVKARATLAKLEKARGKDQTDVG